MTDSGIVMATLIICLTIVLVTLLRRGDNKK